ncbi:hypothetical protein TRIUR3_05236 [Triticum urartu]|uniref:Uncharacterized protein n=1 Tax=Triticum urartu TaxID=4572 RepID=M7YWM8_TRIUA|nr:hypothetical protein TRIUR3_05236 [Triticum urartu]
MSIDFSSHSSLQVTVEHKKVNNALMDLIKATKYAMAPQEWSSQPENTSDSLTAVGVFDFAETKDM